CLPRRTGDALLHLQRHPGINRGRPRLPDELTEILDRLATRPLGLTHHLIHRGATAVERERTLLVFTGPGRPRERSRCVPWTRRLIHRHVLEAAVLDDAVQ